jgi:hypothetical protein
MYNWTTGVAVPIPAVTASFVTVLQAEIAKYSGIWTQRFAPISAVGYKVGCIISISCASLISWILSFRVESRRSLRFPLQTGCPRTGFRHCQC